MSPVPIRRHAVVEGNRRRGRPRRWLLVFATLGVVLAACSASEEPAADGETVPDAAVEVPDLATKPDMSIVLTDDRGDPPSDLEITDLVEGDGETAMPGDAVTVHYVGASWSSGAQFDASWDRDQPFSFTLGAGQVIDGWEQGVEGMEVGGRRVLIIPPELAYGDRGAGNDIAPGETIAFVVDLLEVER